MKARLLRLWERWKVIGHAIGRAWTVVLVSGFYFLVIGPAAAVAALLRKDLLGLRESKESYYRTRQPVEDTLDRYTHLF